MIIEARGSSQQDGRQRPSVIDVGNCHRVGPPHVETIFQFVGEKVTKAVKEIVFKFTPRTLTLQPVLVYKGKVIANPLGKNEANDQGIVFFGDKRKKKNNGKKRPDGNGTYSIPNENAREYVRNNRGIPINKKRKKRFWILPW